MRARVTTLLAVLSICSLAACSTPTPAATGSAEDEQAIRDMAGKYAAAYGARDTVALGALLAEDYEEVDPTGRHTQGRSAYLQAAAQEFAAMPAGMSMTMTATTTYVRWVDANHAVAGGTWGTSPAMPGMPNRGSWMGVMVKKDSGWQMMSALGSADMTAMTPPAPVKP